MFGALINQFSALTKRKLVLFLLLSIIVLSIIYIAQSFDFEKTIKALAFVDGKDATWLNGKFAYFIFASLVVSIGAPRQIISFFAAYFFGLWMGIFIGILATSLACAISFYFARLFKSYFKGLLKGKIKLAFDFWKNNTFFATMIWRFIPAGSNLLTNLVAGAFGVSALPFIAGSALGFIPHTVVFALLGAGVELGSNFQLIASAILFIVSILLGLILYKKYQAKLLPSA